MHCRKMPLFMVNYFQYWIVFGFIYAYWGIIAETGMNHGLKIHEILNC